MMNLVYANQFRELALADLSGFADGARVSFDAASSSQRFDQRGNFNFRSRAGCTQFVILLQIQP